MSLLRVFVLRQDGHLRQLQGFIGANWEACAKNGKPLEVVISEHRAKRSVEQNAKLHALLSEIAGNAWVNGKQFDADTWKEHFRRLYIGTEEIILPDGKRIERGISTTTLDVEQFSSLIEKINAYAATELGLELAL